MFCTQCGAQIKDTARFCPKCGAVTFDVTDSVGADSVPSAEPQASPAQAPTQSARAPQQAGQQRQTSVPVQQVATAPKKYPVIAVVLPLALTILGVLSFAWYKGLINLPFLPGTPAATQTTLTVEAPGLDESGSRVPVRIFGTTEAGEAYDQQTYLLPDPAPNEPITLEDGTYTVEVLGSPISSDGVIYSYEEAKTEVTIPESEASEDGAEEPIKLELVPIEAAEVTDEQIAEAVEWARNDSERADVADALQEAATARRNEAIPLRDRVAASYEEVLDDAQSYFADEWFGETTDREIRYCMAEMTGDDIPELILNARYEGLGPNGNPRKRYIPFVFDASTGDVQPVTFESDELSMYEDSWTSYYQGSDHHSVILDQRDGWDSPHEYYRVWIEDMQLMREEASESDRIGDMVDGYGGLPVTDRSYIDWVRDKLSSPEGAAEPEPVQQASAHDFECDYFYVDVPDTWSDDYWSVEQVGENEWRFSKGSGNDDGGSTDIKVVSSSDGLPSGYDLVGSGTAPDGTAVSLYKRGAGASFFGNNKAELTIKG